MEIKKYDLRLSGKKAPVLVATDTFSLSNTLRLEHPKTAISMMNNFFPLLDMAEEYVYMLALNSAMIPLGIFEVSHGSINESVLCPREVFIRLLLCGAAGMILVHNHPSGSLQPSKNDVDVFRRFCFSAKMMGIKFWDFIILGDGFFSFRNEDMFADEK